VSPCQGVTVSGRQNVVLRCRGPLLLRMSTASLGCGRSAKCRHSLNFTLAKRCSIRARETSEIIPQLFHFRIFASGRINAEMKAGLLHGENIIGEARCSQRRLCEFGCAKFEVPRIKPIH
jgi:hypothetical protein